MGKFNENLAPALFKKPYSKHKALWGFINKKGDIVIKPKFVYVSDFSDGYAVVTTEIGFPRTRSSSEYPQNIKKEECKLGYINKSGKFITEKKFCMARSFEHGLAYVGTEDKVGYINTNGNFVWSQETSKENVVHWSWLKHLK